MATLTRVNEYIRVNSAGVSTITATGSGQRIAPNRITWIYWAGYGDYFGDERNVFTVYMVNGKSIITDWAGISDLMSESGNFVRVNEYARTKWENGQVVLQYTDHGIRVNCAEVVSARWAGEGYELDGETTHNLFKIRLTTGETFITDWAGLSDINGAGGPFTLAAESVAPTEADPATKDIK